MSVSAATALTPEFTPGSCRHGSPRDLATPLSGSHPPSTDKNRIICYQTIGTPRSRQDARCQATGEVAIRHDQSCACRNLANLSREGTDRCRSSSASTGRTRRSMRTCRSERNSPTAPLRRSASVSDMHFLPHDMAHGPLLSPLSEHFISVKISPKHGISQTRMHQMTGVAFETGPILY